MSNLEAIAEAIGEAVMDAIEHNRRINKGDLVDAAHNVLRRRHALLGVEAEIKAANPLLEISPEVWAHYPPPPNRPARPDYREADRAPTWINHRPPGMEPKPSKLPRLIVRGPDGSVRRVTEEEAAVLHGACCQRDAT